MNNKVFATLLIILFNSASLFAAQAMGISAGSFMINPKKTINHEAFCTQWAESIPTYRTRYTTASNEKDIVVTVGSNQYGLSDAIANNIIKVYGINDYAGLKFENLTNSPISVEVKASTILFENQNHKATAFVNDEAERILAELVSAPSQEKIWEINKSFHGESYITKTMQKHTEEEKQLINMMNQFRKNLNISDPITINVGERLEKQTQITSDEIDVQKKMTMIGQLVSLAQNYSLKPVFDKGIQGVHIVNGELRYSGDLTKYTEFFIDAESIQNQYEKINSVISMYIKYNAIMNEYAPLFGMDGLLKSLNYRDQAIKLGNELEALEKQIKDVGKELENYQPKNSRGYELLNNAIGRNIDANEYTELVKSDKVYEFRYSQANERIQIGENTSNLSLVTRETHKGPVVTQRGNLKDLQAVINVCERINNTPSTTSKFFNIVQVGGLYRLYSGKGSTRDYKSLSEVAKAIKEYQDKGNIIYVTSFNLEGTRKAEAMVANLKKEMINHGETPIFFRNDPPVETIEKFFLEKFEKAKINVTEEDWGVKIEAVNAHEKLIIRIYTSAKEITAYIVASIKLLINSDAMSTMSIAELNALIRKDLRTRYSVEQLTDLNVELERSGLTIILMQENLAQTIRKKKYA